MLAQVDNLFVKPLVMALIEDIDGKVEVEFEGGRKAVPMLLLVEVGRDCPNGVGILNPIALDCEG